MTVESSPSLEFERRACSRCGATNVTEAETKCRPSSDETGEWFCPAGDNEDAEGYFLRLTEASLAELDAWCERQMKAMEINP